MKIAEGMMRRALKIPQMRMVIIRSLTFFILEKSESYNLIFKHQWKSVFLNIMFYAPMGRFQLESKLELPLFSGFTVVLFVPVGLLSIC